MTKFLLSAVLLSIVGCAKANDVGRMEDEAIATAVAYQPTVHELEVRANDLLKVPLAPEPASLLRDAKAQISHLKGEIAGTNRVELDKMAASDPELIQKKSDNVQHNLHEGIILATDQLEAVESWIAVAERSPGTLTQ